MPIKTPPQEWLKEKLSYDPESGWLAWKARAASDFGSSRLANTFNSRCAGKRAGAAKEYRDGYVCRVIALSFEGRCTKYLEHRIIWKIMNGCEPPDQLDHIDRDATNNKWENLRDGTDINPRNLTMYSTNTSGVTGVCWSSVRERWVVQISVSGKIKRFGEFDEDDLDLAAMEAMESRIELGYDPHHGSPKEAMISPKVTT